MRYAANPNIWGGSKYGIKNVCAELANSTDTGTALARHTAQIDDLHRRFKEMLERLPSPGELISSKDALKLVRDTTLNDAFIMALILVNSRDKEIAQQVESKLQAIVRPLKSDILDDLEDKVRTLRADGNTIPVDLADNVDRVLADFINSIDDPAASTLYPNRIRAVLDYLPEVLKRHSRSSSSIILINQQWKEHRISDRQAVLAAISVLDG